MQNELFTKMYANAESVEVIKFTTADANFYDMFTISSITDTLISTAGRICKRHSSDLLIDLKYIKKILNKHVDSEGLLPPDLYILGFRENGVDSDTNFAYNINKSENITEDYSKVYAICIEDSYDGYSKTIAITLKDITQVVISENECCNIRKLTPTRNSWYKNGITHSNKK